MKNKELPFVKDMFDTIAPWYDFLNRLLSLRQDVSWRRITVAAMNIPPDGKVLDMACGTGDVAIEIVKQKGKGVRVIGADFSPKMLRHGKEKLLKNREGRNISLLAANALAIPFKNETFDAATIAFGIRNIGDKVSALKSFKDGLKNGGEVFVLELATPRKGLLLDLYLLYFNKILPMIGGLFSKSDFAYTYLPASVINFPQPEEFAAIMREAGFKDIKWKRLTFGIATLFTGRKG